MDGQRLGAEAMARLRGRGVCAIGPGLTDAEFTRIETEYGFAFADDHRAFLAAGLPSGTGTEPGRPDPWPDWRDGDPAALRQALDRPVEGVLFDVENNAFWYPDWGPRPDDPATALATARRMLARVPRMVPIYAHRYLPAGRGTSAHPVLSMMQTDIIFTVSTCPTTSAASSAQYTDGQTSPAPPSSSGATSSADTRSEKDQAAPGIGLDRQDQGVWTAHVSARPLAAYVASPAEKPALGVGSRPHRHCDYATPRCSPAPLDLAEWLVSQRNQEQATRLVQRWLANDPGRQPDCVNGRSLGHKGERPGCFDEPAVKGADLRQQTPTTPSSHPCRPPPSRAEPRPP